MEEFSRVVEACHVIQYNARIHCQRLLAALCKFRLWGRLARGSATHLSATVELFQVQISRTVSHLYDMVWLDRELQAFVSIV